MTAICKARKNALRGRSDIVTNGELIRYSDYDTLAVFLHRLEAGAIIECKADSVEALREWLDEDAEEE